MTKNIVMALALAACATAPKSASSKRDLEDQASATLSTMMAKDSALHGTLMNSAGYAVFPNIGKGGFIAGAAYGKGVLYEHGSQIGYVELNQASIGAQIGAESFSELVVFQSSAGVQKVKGGQFSTGGNASAVLLTAGAGGAAQFVDGVAVFVLPKGGAMAELSVSGQQINFQPLGG